RDAAGEVDRHVRHPDSSRPPYLQAEAAVRSLRGAGKLRLLPRSDGDGRRGFAGSPLDEARGDPELVEGSRFAGAEFRDNGKSLGEKSQEEQVIRKEPP